MREVQTEPEAPAEVSEIGPGLGRTGRIVTVTNWELGAGDLAMPRAAKDRVRRTGRPAAPAPEKATDS